MENRIDVPTGLRWIADGRDEDDSPVVEIADDERAWRLVGVPGSMPEDPVERWCSARLHLERWLKSPDGLDALLKEPLGVMPKEDAITFGDIRMPEALARLLRNHDVHPAAFGAMAAWGRGAWDVSIEGVEVRMRMVVENRETTPRITATCQPPGIVMFDMADRQVAIEQRLPAAALSRAIGGPLSDVFSHPFTDPLGLVLYDHHDWIGDVLVYEDRDARLDELHLARGATASGPTLVKEGCARM